VAELAGWPGRPWPTLNFGAKGYIYNEIYMQISDLTIDFKIFKIVRHVITILSDIVDEFYTYII
jgi:hypothetical protein